MKTQILNFILGLLALPSLSQGLVVQAEQMEAQVVNQNGVMLISSLGESMNSLDLSEDLSLVGGFYPAALFDTSGPSGIQEYPPLEGIRAWPNPTNNAVVLEAKDIMHVTFQITLFNKTGQEIESYDWNAGSPTIEIPLETVMPGAYFIEVFDRIKLKRTVLTVVKQ